MPDLVEDGVVVYDKVFSRYDQLKLDHVCVDITGVEPGDKETVAITDAANRYRQLWPFVTHGGLISHLISELGGDVRFLFHSDLFVNYKTGMTRNSVDRGTECTGKCWEESEQAYDLVRVMFGPRPFPFKYIPQTHKVSGKDPKRAETIVVEPGSVILSDPRLFVGHGGSPDYAPAFMGIYGTDSVHSQRHRDYILGRKDLGYRQPSPQWFRQLVATDLLCNV